MNKQFLTTAAAVRILMVALLGLAWLQESVGPRWPMC
jgi:hypothetical protein